MHGTKEREKHRARDIGKTTQQIIGHMSILLFIWPIFRPNGTNATQ